MKIYNSTLILFSRVKKKEGVLKTFVSRLKNFVFNDHD